MWGPLYRCLRSLLRGVRPASALPPLVIEDRLRSKQGRRPEPEQVAAVEFVDSRTARGTRARATTPGSHLRPSRAQNRRDWRIRSTLNTAKTGPGRRPGEAGPGRATHEVGAASGSGSALTNGGAKTRKASQNAPPQLRDVSEGPSTTSREPPPRRRPSRRPGARCALRCGPRLRRRP